MARPGVILPVCRSRCSGEQLAGIFVEEPAGGIRNSSRTCRSACARGSVNRRPVLRKVYGFTSETGPWAGNVEESFQPPFPEANWIMEETISGLLPVLHSCVRHRPHRRSTARHDDDSLDTMGPCGMTSRPTPTRARREWHCLNATTPNWCRSPHTTTPQARRRQVDHTRPRILHAEQFDPDQAREVRAVLGQLKSAELSTELRADLRRLHVLTRQLEGRQSMRQ